MNKDVPKHKQAPKALWWKDQPKTQTKAAKPIATRDLTEYSLDGGEAASDEEQTVSSHVANQSWRKGPSLSEWSRKQMSQKAR